LFITQNNGCVIDLQNAIEAPVLTISAGPTNSFIGASRLVDRHDAVIVDIGGTSTDVGLIKHGFPKRTLNTSNIGGVRLNFPMPDVLSIALGGGSYVSPAAAGYHVGPQSAGMNIVKEALCFGGERLTLTDIAVANGHLSIPSADAKRIRMHPSDVQNILSNVYRKISYEIDRMDGGQKDLPVLLVGGGAALIPPDLLGPRHIVPHHANVANAYGAALAEVAGTVDTVISLTKREEVIEKLKNEAQQQAINKGADGKTVRVIDLQIIPYSYMPENLARVTVVAAGKQQKRV
jgi:N-methylhydantoinase A/oxoprolinase/acetone carboxylase beta subunit